MLRRGRKSCIGVALAVSLLLAASPGHAAVQPVHGAAWMGWERLWTWALDWLGGGGQDLSAVPPVAREKYSAGIDPLGQPAPTGTTTSTTQSDSSGMIDPLGGH